MEPVYRPQHKEAQSLIEDFVIREREYQQLIESINADMPNQAPQHIILQGVRGMGKTTLMYRAFYELNNRYREEGVLPVIFSEEQYSVRALYKLWEEIAQYLEENEPAYSGILQKMESLESANDDAYEGQSFELLKNEIKKQDHRLVLFIDNFGVMVDKFKKRDQQRLREILIDFPRIKIIGGSAVVLESFYRYDKPFFEFFKVLHLDKLNTQEVRTMLRMLGKRYGNQDEVEEIITNQPGRVESLRILTNGVPRTIVLLFNIFLDNINGNSIDDLKQLMDRVTPLYQHRMDNLPPQQQEIVEKLALNWDGMSVAELKKKTRMSSKAISAQLNNLEKSQIITSAKSSGKNKFYQLEERFFNIWYLMHHAPRSYKKKVIWLTRFLELWCGDQTLRKSLKYFEIRLKNEALNPEYTLSLVYAYAQARGVSGAERDGLIETAQNSLQTYNPELVKALPRKTNDFFEQLESLVNKKALNEATGLIEQTALPKSISDTLMGFVKHKAQLYKEAEEYYLRACEDNEVGAMYSLGLLYIEKKDFENAEKYLLMAIDRGNVEAMFNLGTLYKEKDDFKNAEKFYLKAIEHNEVKAMNNLAMLYREKNDFKNAEKYFLKATDHNSGLALNNLLDMYIQNNFFVRTSEVKPMIDEIIDKNGGLRVKLLKSRFLIWVNQPKEAFPYLKTILPEIFEEDEEYINLLGDLLAFAIAKGLRQAVLKLFTQKEYQLQDRLKVVYYEIRRMGKELEEPVNEMVDYIKGLEEKYHT